MFNLQNSMLPAVIISILLFASCIKDEPLNAEADIESATIENAADILETQPTIGNDFVHFRLQNYSGDFHFSPEFTLSPGAIISPENGTPRDFSLPRDYTVTSENGKWKKTYYVSFTVNDNSIFDYSFEHVETVDTDNPEGHYHRFFTYSPTGQKVYDWDTGNEGYNILAASLLDEGEELTPAFYPTSQTPNGYEEKGVKMQTKETGSLGEMVGSPLAAGNLFIGDFVLTFPTIKATHFGKRYHDHSKPVALKGYFKYKPGDDFIVNTEPSQFTQDTWDAYAILFEKSDQNNYLLGDHHFEDPKIVSVAHLNPEQRIETDEWTSFYIPFQMVDGKSFDLEKEYMYTIVFSSSIEGAKYNGAPGSTLYIDEVELITEDSSETVL